MYKFNAKFLFLGLLVLSLSACTNLNATNEEIERCIQERNELYGDDFMAGGIIVSFTNETIESDVEVIASDYGLFIDRISTNFERLRWASFNVPKGEEIEWICKLIFHKQVESASIDKIEGIASQS